jgi:hypothetical protein
MMVSWGMRCLLSFSNTKLWRSFLCRVSVSQKVSASPPLSRYGFHVSLVDSFLTLAPGALLVLGIFSSATRKRSSQINQGTLEPVSQFLLFIFGAFHSRYSSFHSESIIVIENFVLCNFLLYNLHDAWRKIWRRQGGIRLQISCQYKLGYRTPWA